MKEKEKIEHAYHGSEWAEHEDYLVGDKAGLEKLKFAISEAIENGESTIDVGEFIGVRCLDSSFFESKEEKGGFISYLVSWVLVAGVVFVFVVGIANIASWFKTIC